MSVRFTIADRSHDAGIRRLLRETPMAGRDVSVSLRCEPSYFDAVAVEGDHHAIVALDGDEVVCVGGVSVRDRYYNGRPARVGYLGHLRLARSHAGRADVLRRGYERFRESARSLNIDVLFTTVADGNGRALRLLERGGRGLPTYVPVGRLVTLLIGVPWWRGWGGRTTADEWDGRPYQFAPVDPVGDGLCDLRTAKQAVVAGYSRELAIVRPVVNPVRVATGLAPPMPAVGRAIEQVFVTRFTPPARRLGPRLAAARRRGAAAVTVTLDARDPRLPSLRWRHHPIEYATRVYTVGWPGEPRADPADDRLMYPEGATL